MSCIYDAFTVIECANKTESNLRVSRDERNRIASASVNLAYGAQAGQTDCRWGLSVRQIVPHFVPHLHQ